MEFYNKNEHMKEYLDSNTATWITMLIIAIFIIFELGLGWYLLKKWRWI